ncbi:MAG: vanadium-dependent haloperoxidase, partial [Cocleimonas sp.]
ALRTQRQSDFNAINLASGATRKLANPQGSDRFPLTGTDGYATRMPKAPTFRSKTTAAEMGELYWLALTRDVDFNDYGSNPDIANALTDLNNFTRTVGPKQGGKVTFETIFRGETADDLAGDYISQFLIKDVPYGPSLIEQKYNSNAAGEDFMTDNDTWLTVQNGGVSEIATVDDGGRRYIHNSRSLGEYVHGDALFQAYFNASLIMLGSGSPLDNNNPYLALPNEGAFTSFGGPMIFDLLTQAANLALQGAWYHKWQVHRRLRPEEFGGRVHHKINNHRNYEISSEILNSAAIAQVYSNTGSHFLPMAYVEGSPTHPAYPAGHSTVAGACSTVLKALFDESALISNPEEVTTGGTVKQAYTGSDTLTVGGEINKLAANITLGRDAAGVHYRSDGVEGLEVGEQQAIGLLRDYSITFNEQFEGFQFTKFDGTPVVIRNGRV